MKRSALPSGALASLVALTTQVALAQPSFGPPPDPTPIPERRAALLKKYDADKDGRLSQEERETMRREWTAAQMKGGGNQRRGFRLPPELMEEFDKNKDGELSSDEEMELQTVMRKRIEDMTRRYDKDGDGRLDDEEMAAARTGAEAGKLPGIPRFFFMRGPRGGRGAGPGGGPPASIPGTPEFLKRFDADGDGRMSASELAAARAERDRLIQKPAANESSPKPSTEKKP